MSESMSPEELSNYYLTWAGVRAESYMVVFVPEENDDGEYEGGYIAFVVDRCQKACSVYGKEKKDERSIRDHVR